MDVSSLSSSYGVRRLAPGDVDRIYALSRENTLFYQYHPPFVTHQSILEDMTALPPGKTAADKYYVGFFAGDCLIAVMDLILGYPAQGTAFIGLFMTAASCQRRGIGSGIISETAASLKAAGYLQLRLGVDPGNPQSFAFWQKNGFSVVSEGAYIVMERAL